MLGKMLGKKRNTMRITKQNLFIIWICDLCNLVWFVQFKKREIHPWRNLTLSKVTGFSQIAQSIPNADDEEIMLSYSHGIMHFYLI